MKKFIVMIIVFALVVTGGVVAYQNDLFSQYIPILMNRFRPQTEEGVIAVSGNVEITEVNIGFTLSGRIQELFAQEGQTVPAGQVLARLENAELQSVVEQNTAMLNEALLRLDDLKTGARAQEVEEAKANVGAIDAELNRAKKDYDRAKTMREQNLIPDSQLDAAKSVYNAAVARRTQAVERLSLVQAGPTEDNIKATEFKVEQTRAALRGAEERLKNTEDLDPHTRHYFAKKCGSRRNYRGRHAGVHHWRSGTSLDQSLCQGRQTRPGEIGSEGTGEHRFVSGQSL